jgi:PAS domain S-box-containing protein
MVILVLVGLVISLGDLRKQEEQKNLAVSHALSFAYGVDIRNVLLGYGGVNRFETALQQQLQRTSSLKINVFDSNSKVVYSTDKSVVGEAEQDNQELQEALKGDTASEYESFEVVRNGATETRRVAAIYLPVFESELMKGGSDEVLGVLEVYSDVTPQVNALYLTHLGLAVAATLMLVTVFGGIYLLIRRQVKATEKSQAELERYALLVRQTPTILMEVTRAGQFLFCNPSARKAFPELAGLETVQVRSASRHGLLSGWESITQNLQPGATFERELTLPDLAGGERNYLQKVSYNEQSHNYDIYIYDVTQQKRSEAELLRAQREQRAILDAIPDMIFVNDQEGNFLDYKVDADHSISEQVIGKNVAHLSFMTPELAQRYRSVATQTLSSKKQHLLEHDLGEGNLKRSFEARMVPLADDKVMTLVRDITERKNQERTVRESETKLRSLFAALPELVFVIRKDGVLLEAQLNEEHPTLEPMIGRNISDLSFIPEDVASSIKGAALRAIESGQIQTLEYPLKSSTGMSEYEAQFVALDSERVLYVVRDITERKVQERALRESEAKNRSLVSAFPDLIFVVDRQSKFLEVQLDEEHPLMEPLVGRTFEDISFIPSTVATALKEKIVAALETRTLQTAEYSLPSVDRMSDYEARFVALDDERVLYISRDVTERRQRELALQASEAQVRSLLEAIPDMVFVMSRDGTYLDFKLDKSHGLIEDLVGRNVRQLSFVPPGVAESIVAKLEAAGRTDQTQTLEYALEGNIEGKRKLAHYEARFTKIDAQKVLMFVRDVTKRYENEWALQASEAQVRSLLEAIPDMVFVMSKDGQYLDYKLDKSHQMLEELVGRNVKDMSFMTPEVVEGLLAKLKLASSTQETQVLEYSLDGYFGDGADGGDGELRRLTHYEARFAPVDKEKILMVVRDVTKRFEDEQRLRELYNVSRLQADELSRQTDELELLEHLRTLISNKTELGVLFQTVNEVITQFLNYELVATALVQGGNLVVQHQLGYSQPIPDDPSHLGVEGRVIRNNRAELIKNVKADPDYIEVEPGAKSEVCVPLVLKGQVVGVLIVESVQQSLSEKDLHLLEKLGAYISLAMEQAQLYEEILASEQTFRELYAVSQAQSSELARRTTELELLEQIRTMIADKLEPASLFKAVTEAVSQLLNYDQVATFLLRGQTLEMQHQIGYDMTVFPTSLDIHQGVIGRIARTGQAALVQDAHADPDHFGLANGVTSELGVPIIIQGKITGVIHVESRRSVLSETQLETLKQIANYVSLALEQAELYQELQQSEVRYRELIENATDIIYRIDLTGTFTYSNSVVKRIMDYSEEEIIGMNYLELVRSDERERVQQFYIEQLTNNELTSYLEFPAVAKDGTEVWIGQSVGLVRENGKVTGMQAVARDITERKRMEEALVQQAEELASANADLEQFAFIAAHDLQEPLRKIQAFGDRLNLKYSKALDDTGRDYLERMRGSATRMRTLIDDLLSFARANKQQKREVTSLEPIIRGVLGDLQIRAEETEATISVGTMPTLEVDPSQMRQVFQNIIGNALKFRRPGVPPVITVYSHRQPTGDWQIRISDNGIGFDEQYKERIFAVFQRLHSREQYEGTGIGLAIVRRIIEGHGGSIEVTSRLNEGTTFYVTLPSVAKIHTDETQEAVLA